MVSAERKPFRWIRWIGLVLTFPAASAFVTSFFLPAARPMALWGTPLDPETGWQIFLGTFELPVMAGFLGGPIAFLCLLSPLLNGLMLLALPANLTLRHHAVFLGAFLIFSGALAFWVCWQVYEGLTVGFYLWLGSILVMAVSSCLIGGSWFMEDNVEHERLLAELTKTYDVPR